MSKRFYINCKTPAAPRQDCNNANKIKRQLQPQEGSHIEGGDVVMCRWSAFAAISHFGPAISVKILKSDRCMEDQATARRLQYSTFKDERQVIGLPRGRYMVWYHTYRVRTVCIYLGVHSKYIWCLVPYHMYKSQFRYGIVPYIHHSRYCRRRERACRNYCESATSMI